MSAKEGKLRVETVGKTVKGKVYTSVLLRRSFRKDGKVQHETLGNLTRLPPDVIEFVKRRLNGELAADAPHSSFEIIRSLPHGNVAAVLQTATQLGLEGLLASRPCRERDLIMALVVARVLSPRSKLSTTTALAEERVRKRNELLKATEKNLEPIRLATKRKSLRGEQEIGLRVGKVIDKHKMAKHFDLTITENSFAYARNEGRIREEAALDGLYVVRSSVDEKQMDSDRVVETYKSLAKVERAFRCMKTIDLSLRPIYHRNEERIRSHVFICILAYYVEWHMREALLPLLFADDDRESAAAARSSIVAPAQRSESAKRKDATQRTSDDYPVQSSTTS